MTKRRIYPFTLLTMCSAYAVTASATDWVQFGYDQAHTGNNTAEQGFGNGTAIYHVAILSSAEASPIYLSNVVTATGTKNLLYIVTKNGTLLALDAANGSQLWMKRPTPASGSNLTTGSAAVDPSLLYVYAYGLDGKVHKYAVGDGTETLTGGWPQLSTLKPSVEKGASGMAISTPPGGTNYLYSVTDGYVGDGGDYQGHITSINLSTGAQTVFNSLCSDVTVHMSTSGTNCTSARNGIWGRPGATYDAGTNRIYIVTGNGPFNASSPTNGKNWGDSVLALAVDGTGTGVNGLPRDSYTPTSFQGLENTDADLGSVSLAIIPAPAGSSVTHLGMQVAKDSCVRLINLDNMSGAGAPAHVGGQLHQIALPNGGSNCASGNDSGGNEVKPQPAVWVNPVDSSSWFFVANPAGLTAYKVTLNAGVPQSAMQWTKGSTDGSCSSPVIANSVLYCVSTNKVRALNPVTGAVNWSDTAIGSIKWQSPIIVDGHLYVVDATSQIWSYALDGIFKNGVE